MEKERKRLIILLGGFDEAESVVLWLGDLRLMVGRWEVDQKPGIAQGRALILGLDLWISSLLGRVCSTGLSLQRVVGAGTPNSLEEGVVLFTDLGGAVLFIESPPLVALG
jgi:hypothetical protein